MYSVESTEKGSICMDSEKRDAATPLPISEAESKDRVIQEGQLDTYLDKLIRYIPGDLVAAYLALDGLMREEVMNAPFILYWIVFASLLILTPLYVIYRPTHNEFSGHSRRFHALAATLAFSVWVFVLGGPFAITWPDSYRPLYGSVLLVITTLAMPILEKVMTKIRFFK